jgi:hypothetical protein
MPTDSVRRASHSPKTPLPRETSVPKHGPASVGPLGSSNCTWCPCVAAVLTPQGPLCGEHALWWLMGERQPRPLDNSQEATRGPLQSGRSRVPCPWGCSEPVYLVDHPRLTASRGLVNPDGSSHAKRCTALEFGRTTKQAMDLTSDGQEPASGQRQAPDPL